MVFRRVQRPEIVVLALAAILRGGGIVLSVLRINPYANHDTTKFTAHAHQIAMTTLAGHPQTGLLFWPHFNLLGGAVKIYNLWGLALSPAYLLWGPSAIYARLVLAALGVFAVWNVFALGRAVHSRWAGLVAALPVAVYPSIVLVQSTVLRESMVLFLLTSVARLAIAPPRRFRRPTRMALAVAGLIGVILLRWELWTLCLFVLVVSAVMYHDLRTDGGVSDWIATYRAGAFVMAILVLYGAWRVAERAARYLTHLHQRRAAGRTVYLADVTFFHVPQMLAFAPVAAAYFLFTPFPWMIATPADVVVALEALGNVFFAIAAVMGIRSLLVRSRPLSIRVRAGWMALCVGFLAGVVLFGLGTANVGTAVRHRQMFVWVMYLFGGVGFIEWLPAEWTDRLPSKTTL